jgi:hypothetical protein
MRRILLLLFALCLAVATPGAGTCGPLLNEVMGHPTRDWNGDGVYDYKNDEWVEIVNPGPGNLTLNGYLLTDDLGKPVFGFTGTLAAGAVLVTFGSQSVQWETSHGYSTTGLRLANSADTVILKQVVGADTLVVDAYTYNNYEADADRSSGRRPDGSTHWEIFDALNPYNGATPPLGNGLMPSPGALNGLPAVPAEIQNWGRIKALYSAR